MVPVWSEESWGEEGMSWEDVRWQLEPGSVEIEIHGVFGSDKTQGALGRHTAELGQSMYLWS